LNGTASVIKLLLKNGETVGTQEQYFNYQWRLLIFLRKICNDL